MTEENQPPNNELEKCKNQAEEYLNNWKRERADLINYKKDETKRMEEFLKFSNEGFVLEILDVLDNLEMASRDINNSGLDQVLNKFHGLLKRYDVEKIKAEGDFDPLLHEAVEGTEGNNIQEIWAGYTMHGKVIRPTRVKIVK